MSTYIKFTDDQLAAANRVSIVDLMRRSGYRLKREGSEYAWQSPTGKVDDPCPKYPMAVINDRYNQLKRLSENRKEAVVESAYALSGAAFLFVRKLMKTQELVFEEWELAKLLFSQYPPHRDNVGYRSRITSMGERLTELKRTWGYGGDKTKTELLNIMELGMKLAVDGLRLCMYMEQETKETVTSRQKQEGDQKEDSAEQEETEGELCLC